ncbi:peptidylprolyl isomerase [Candidatus Fermentibacteria bacterium]|nr:peptidylprolyl isomerase [Candidatus Fermentibacteria bacterium]
MKADSGRTLAFSSLNVALAILCAGSPAYTQTVAEWQTTMGMFRCELREDLVPITAGNFIDLTNAGFYDGCIFHRVIDDFVIQDGDPTGTGEGGPGYTIPDEFHPDLNHNAPGILSMANAGPNTGGSQYFITLTPQPHLNNQHAVFGRVVMGLDVVQAIGDVPTDNNDRPIVPVVIDTLRILGIIYPHLDLEELTVAEDPADSDGDGVINPTESGILTLRITNWAGWQDADSIIGTLTCVDSRVQITEGAIDFGFLPNGASTDNLSWPFRFTITSNEVFSTTLRLEIVANPGSDHPYSQVVDIPLPVTLNQAGWPQSFTSSSSPLIIDLDRDGANEVVLADQQGFVHAFRADASSELPGFPVALGGTVRTAVAAGNLDDDEALELVVTKRTPNAIAAIDHTGAVLFTHQTDEFLMANPIIADVDDDGTAEIVAVTMSTGSVLILRPDGEAFPGFPASLGATVRASGAVADLNNDGYLDVVVVSNASGGSLHAISTADGAELPGWPCLIGAESANGPTVTDLDGGGPPEALVATDGGVIYCVNHDGSVRFSKTVSAPVKTSIVVADLDGDDRVDVVFVSNDGAVHAIDRQGGDLPGFPISIVAPCQSTPVLADMNGNGSIDIVFGDGAGYLHAIDITGDALPPFPMALGPGVLEGISMGLLDDDADVELAVVAGTRCYVIDTKRQAQVIWPCFKGNPRRTGNTADISTSSPDWPPLPAAALRLDPVFPNPFVGSVSLRFSTTVPGLTSLRVYDLSGRMVASLFDGMLPAGDHAVRWNGRDSLGRPSASGTYLCTLTSHGRDMVRRIVHVSVD